MAVQMTDADRRKLRKLKIEVADLKRRLRAVVILEREACARTAEAWAKHYPTTVFREDSDSPDAQGARMARHTSKMIAEEIRKRGGGR